MPIFICMWIEVPSKTADFWLENSAFKFWWLFVATVEGCYPSPFSMGG